MSQPGLFRMIEIASYCGEFIVAHISNFLDMSKASHQKIDLTLTPTNVETLVTKLVEMHKFKAESKGVALRFFASDNLPDVAFLDNGRVGQVLVNLISNSLKFTDQGNV